jgi:hypothetical protein
MLFSKEWRDSRGIQTMALGSEERDGAELQQDRDSYALDTSRFSDVGLTEPFAAWVQQRRYPLAWKRRVKQQLFLCFLLMLLGFAGLFTAHFALWKFLEALRTRQTGGVFHYDQSGVSYLICAVFLIIFGAAALLTVLQDRSAARTREHDILASLIMLLPTPGANGYLSRQLYRWLFRDLGILRADQQLDELVRLNRNLYLVPTGWLALLVVVLFVRDFRDYSLITPAGATTHNTWTTLPSHSSWQDLEEVRVGCWIFDKEGLRLFYTPRFKDGTEVNLLSDRPKPHDFAMAEFVDQLVRERGLKKHVETFAYGIHRGEPKAHPDCPAAIMAKYPQEVAELLTVP